MVKGHSLGDTAEPLLNSVQSSPSSHCGLCLLIIGHICLLGTLAPVIIDLPLIIVKLLLIVFNEKVYLKLENELIYPSLNCIVSPNMFFLSFLDKVATPESRTTWHSNLDPITHFSNRESGNMWHCIFKLIKAQFSSLCSIKGREKLHVSKIWLTDS